MSTDAPIQLPPPGWYQAPDVPDAQRWWDGTAWTPHLAPVVPPSVVDASADRWVLPVGRSWLAIIAGYLGLLSVLVFPAPFAIGAGVAALGHLRRHPHLGGRGRAWFAIVAGILSLLGFAALIVGTA